MSKNITNKAILALGVVAGLGVAVLPIGSYAAAEDVTVSFGVQSTLASDDMVCDTSDASTGASGVALTSTCSIDASSNGGMTISVKDKDAELSLVHGSDPTAKIAPIANAESGSGELTQEGWALRLAPMSGTGAPVIQGTYAKYTPITSGNVTVVDAPNAGTVAGNIEFSVKTPLSQKPGTYSNTIVVTSTAK